MVHETKIDDIKAVEKTNHLLLACETKCLKPRKDATNAESRPLNAALKTLPGTFAQHREKKHQRQSRNAASNA
jgi:hypothetical protein